MRGHFVFTGKRRQPAQSTHAGALDRLLQPFAIGRKLRAVIPWMPQMQHASSKSSILATHAGAQKTNDEIGILQTPTDKGIIETVDAIEIAARDGQVAGLRAVPTCAVQLAQRAER